MFFVSNRHTLEKRVRKQFDQGAQSDQVDKSEISTIIFGIFESWKTHDVLVIGPIFFVYLPLYLIC